MTHKPNSTVERVLTQSHFKCCALKHHQANAHAEFLRLLEAWLSGRNRSNNEVMIEPSELLLLAWFHYLCQDSDKLGAGPERGRHNKAGAMIKHKRFLSGTLIEL